MRNIVTWEMSYIHNDAGSRECRRVLLLCYVFTAPRHHHRGSTISISTSRHLNRQLQNTKHLATADIFVKPGTSMLRLSTAARRAAALAQVYPWQRGGEAAAHRAWHWLQCEARSPVTAAAAAAAANAQWWQPCVRLQFRLCTHAPVSRHQSRRRVDAHSRFWANKRGLCDSEPVLISIFSTFHHTGRTGSALCCCCPRLGASRRGCGVLNQAGLRPGHAERETTICFVTTWWWCGRRKPHQDQLLWNRTVSQRPACSCRHHLHRGLFWAKQL